MRLFALFFLVGGLVYGQEMLETARGEHAYQLIQHSPPDSLKARITPIRPVFNLSFRFQTGYMIEAPVEQFEGSGHFWAIVIRVTPEGGQPKYLGAIYRLPPVPKTKGETSTAGGMFFLGEGTYTVELLFGDDQGRMTHRSWFVHAERKGAEKKIRPLMAAGTVGSFGSTRWSPVTDTDEKALRLTMLVHAAPSFWRSQVLRPRDVARLLGQMTAILEQVPVRSLRVVAFNLDQQAEIYRQDNFEPNSFEKLRVAIEPVQLGTVDIGVLANKRGHLDLLADLVNRELHSEKPADAVIFIGPLSRTEDRVKSGMIDSHGAGSPKFLYFQYTSPFNAGSSHQADTIESAVKKVGGRVYRIITPGDFAKSIEALKKQMK